MTRTSGIASRSAPQLAKLASRRHQVRARRLIGLEQLEERRVMATSIFQEGVDNGFGAYSGAKDVQLYEAGAGTVYPRGTDSSNTRLLVDFANAANAGQVLLQFDNIFGTGPGQIPQGAKILSASLVLNVTNGGSTTGGTFNRMLVPWSSTTDTWNAFGSNANGRNDIPGIQADNVEAIVGYNGNLGNASLNETIPVSSIATNIVNDVQAWSDGAQNNGWAILPFTNATDGWAFTPSEDATLAARPKLVVEWLPAEIASATFRQGVNGYAGAVDTHLQQNAADSVAGATAQTLSSDADDADVVVKNEVQALFRFDSIFGTGPGQIPLGSTIQRAYLDLVSTTSNAQGDGGRFVRLLTPWSEADTWNTFGNAAPGRNALPGIQNDGIEANVAYNAAAGTSSLSPDVLSGTNSFDVSVDLQAWASGETNNGWAILPWTGGENGWIFGSANNTNEHLRPQLRVVYTPPLQEPTVNTVDVTGGALTFEGGQNLANSLTVAQTGGTYSLTDTSGPITLTASALAAGWTGSGTSTVTGPSTSVNSLNVSTGNGNDSVTIQGFDDALTVNGGGAIGDVIHFPTPLTASADLTITQFGSIDVATGLVVDLASNKLTIDILGGVGSAAKPLRVAAGSIVADGKDAGVFITESDGAEFVATTTGAGEIRLVTIAGTLRVNGATTTETGDITLSSGDDVIVNAQIGDLATSGRIHILANTDGVGDQDYLQTANGSLSTNNTGTQAIVIEVNSASGGNGDAILAPARAPGSYVANARGGSILWNPAFAIPAFNGGNSLTLKANSYSLTSSGSIGTLASPIQTDNLVEGSSVNLAAGSGGIFLTDWGGVGMSIASAVATGAGDVQIVSANGGGHNLTISGLVTTGSGNIRLFADDELKIFGPIGDANFSGTVYLKGNVDAGNAQQVEFGPGASITTTNTTANAVLIEAFPTNTATIPLGGVILDGNIKVGDGGTITINAAAGTAAARSGAIDWVSGVLDAGPSGTVVLMTREYYIGVSPQYSIKVNAGHVIASTTASTTALADENPGIFITALGPATFTATTGSATAGTLVHNGNIDLRTLAGVLTVAGPINTDVGTINLQGEGGVVVSGALGDANTTGNVTITATTGDIVFTVPQTVAGFALTLNEAGLSQLGPNTVVTSTLSAANGVEVGAGETLSGTGTVNANVHVLAGGTLAPSAFGIGTLTINGATLAPGGSMAMQVVGTTAGAAHDQLINTGALDLGGATLQASIDYPAAIGDSFMIVRNDGSAITGQFAQGTSYESGPFVVGINYAGGDGNDIVLTITGILANNVAPVLDNSGNMTLPTIGQGQKNNPGVLIGDLIASAGGDRITDADAGAVEGLAIVAADTTSGTWEYTVDGTQWLALGAVAPTSARLLAVDATTRIRFVPNTGFNGTVVEGLTFHAWDRTFGLNGSQLDVSTNGGNTPFSSATETASITVAPLPTWYLSELLFDAPGGDTGQEYLELRGTPGAIIPQGYYFAHVEGDAAGSGTVHAYINLGGLQFGANGYLVIAQDSSRYTPATGATVVSGTGTGGWTSIPNGRFGGETTSDMENGSATSFLIYTSIPPVQTDDIDPDNNGIPNGPVWDSWEVLDSVGTTDQSAAGTSPDYAYGRLNFVNTIGGGQAVVGNVVNVAYTQGSIGVGYFARIGDTTGSTAADWVGVRGNWASTTPAPVLTLSTDPAENTQPALYGALLNHLGSSNFVVNEPPVITTPGSAQTVNEDFELVFSTANNNAISIADPDAALTSLQVTLTATSGIVTLPATTGLTVTGNGSALVTLSGTLTDINAAIQGLTFQPAANFNGTASLKVDVQDAESAVDSETIDITVSAVNDAPEFALAGDPPASLQDAGPQSVPSFATGMIAGPADEATQTLTFLVVASGTTGNLAFSAAPAIDPMTGELTYTAAPGTFGTATFNVVLADSDSGVTPNINISVTRTFTITVTSVIPNNLPPVNTLPAAPTTNEDTALALAGAGAITVGDPDAGAASIRTTVSLPAGVGTLSIIAQGGATIAGSGSTSIQIDGTIAAINATLATLLFQPLANYHGSTSLTIVTSDLGNSGLGGELNDTDLLSITVAPVNDAPSFNLPASPPASQQDAGPQTVSNLVNAVSAGPADEAGQSLTFQVVVTGTTGNLSFSGAPSIDPLTGALTYTAAAGTSGTATFSVVLIDGGSGTAPNVNTSTARSFTITVNPLIPNNLPPVNALPVAPTTNEDTPLPFSGANAITVSDPDAGSASIRTTVSLPAGVGVLSITAQSGATISGSGTTSIQINGPAAAINATLATLVYQPAANFNGSTTLTIATTDLGNSGPGGAQSDTDALTINITPVNDPPTFNPLGNPPNSTQDEGLQSVPSFATGMSAGPANEAGQPLSFIVTPTMVTSGLTFAVAPTINAATGELRYQATAGASGTATFSVVLSDGQANSVARTFTISVIDSTYAAQIDGPETTVRGLPTNFTFSANTSVANANNSIRYSIDWNGDGRVDETVTGGAEGVPVAHVFPTEGNATVIVTATDLVTGLADSVSHTLSITVMGLVENADGGFDAVFGGTIFADRISVSLHYTGAIQVRLGTKNYILPDADGKIIIYGLDGGDTISVAANVPYDTALYGGAGNDYIAGGIYNDYLDGGDGADRLLGSNGDNSYDGGAGNDALTGRNGNEYMVGGPGNDNIFGSGGDDVIDGGEGNDTLNGSTGNDIVRGGAGTDVIRGEAGHDILIGGDGNDTLYGSNGRDILIGGGQADQLRGGYDDDILIGGKTSYDEDDVYGFNNEDLRLILLDWLLPQSISARANLLFDPLSSSIDSDLNARDTLYGEQDSDWFLVHLQDVISGKTALDRTDVL